MSQQKWVLVYDGGPYVIGPFDNFEDANLYKMSDPEHGNMRTMEICHPARNWRKENPAITIQRAFANDAERDAAIAKAKI
jgi:hypothetical protein